MAQYRSSWCCQLGLTSALAIAGALMEFSVGIIASSGSFAFAQQIIPDSTLGSERSVITPNVLIRGIPSDQIEGGARRGANLFHSFEEFNIEAGRGAYFANPAEIENILSRVTGGSRSDIQGTLGVLGDADLFLINPSGILFGPNSSLDINGSFIASTASSLTFADDNQFSATKVQNTPLLTVSVPNGLQLGETAGGIINQSFTGLQVQPDETIALVGGDVELEGYRLRAAGGRIELWSIAGTGMIKLTSTDKGWRLRRSGDLTTRNIKPFLDYIPPDSQVFINGEEVRRAVIRTSLLLEAPEVVDVSRLVVQDCSAGGGAAGRAASKFVVTGRGGLPTNPYEPLDSYDILAEVQLPIQWGSNLVGAASTSISPKTAPDQIVEAQGWVRGSGGEIVLTAQAPAVTPHSPELASASCRGS